MTTFVIFYGAKEPLKAVGKHQARLLDFAFRYPGLHTYAPDRTTQRAVAGLERRGAIQVYRDSRQFEVRLSA